MKHLIVLCDPPVFNAKVIVSLEAKDDRVKLPVDTAEAAGSRHGKSGQKGLDLLPHGGGYLVFPDKLLKNIDSRIYTFIQVYDMVPEYGEGKWQLTLTQGPCHSLQ